MPSTLRQFVVAFVAAAIVFLPLDGAWLSITASRLYRPALGHVMREDFDTLAAVVFYATYDLTNQATIVRWPWHVTLIDLAWGTFVTATSAWVSYRVDRDWRR